MKTPTWPPGFKSQLTDADRVRELRRKRTIAQRAAAGSHSGGPATWRPEPKAWQGERQMTPTKDLPERAT